MLARDLTSPCNACQDEDPHWLPGGTECPARPHVQAAMEKGEGLAEALGVPARGPHELLGTSESGQGWLIVKST